MTRSDESSERSTQLGRLEKILFAGGLLHVAGWVKFGMQSNYFGLPESEFWWVMFFTTPFLAISGGLVAVIAYIVLKIEWMRVVGDGV